MNRRKTPIYRASLRVRGAKSFKKFIETYGISDKKHKK